MIIYADDTVLLAPSPKALQNLINICVNFAEKHGLVYNERKTKFMCIKPAALKNMYVPNVELNGQKLELVKTEKYLGFIVNDSFKRWWLHKEWDRQYLCERQHDNQTLQALFWGC